jgi:hypothetical protein
MGLLDDAIREHLELKRQHGGDPSEIERQEHEAFGPGGRRAAPDAGEAAPDAEGDEVADAGHEPPPEGAVAVGDPPEAAEPPVQDAAPVEEIEPPPDAQREATAPGREEDPWLVEELADPEPEADDDVLEETPDFLQETPEHDRLWFEQKPPRDFDWDK